MEHNPLTQFTIRKIFPLEILGLDISLTNASLMMIVVTISIVGFFSLVVGNQGLIPSKVQLSGENLYRLINKMLNDNIGNESQKFVPLIFTIFVFILLCNLLGLIPYSYAITSQIIVTFFIASIIFFTIVTTGFIKQGSHFLHVFLPKGVPAWLAPLMITVELFTFLARPVSLSLRLAVNMVAGHILLKVLAGFMVSLPLLYKFLPFPLIVVLIGFETFVAVLQAYIFAILSCVYLSDAIKPH